ncbi:hypothetical protein FB45DRAFT_1022734 [Roridomyces roridus]|uniref:DUF4185 domain-containing protein n=1 Tax=Roridomyces roridus TaxID=1738132 RepID=A0AAD7FW15_9AGAR|nr:hypothetical protein FB45DRAFT_1022734 [Roridomyces roridus]
MDSLVQYLTLALLLSGLATAVPSNERRAVTPVVASTTRYGVLDMQGLNRDSCTSTSWSNNALWVCRDTQPLSNGLPSLPLVPNTASYSSIPSATTPGDLVLTSPQGFGNAFFPLESDECPASGVCSDGSRWVGWPNTAPVVPFSSSTAVNSYAFIPRQHLSGLSVLADAGTTLYHLLWQGQANTMPTVSVAVSSFWSANQVGYGSTAALIHNGFAYLYGPTPSGKLAVARAALTGFLGDLTSKSVYEYYVNGAWTTTAPSNTDSTISLANTVTIQGQIYFSPKWQSFVWIGGDGFPNANFYISTAPNPEGPWSAHTLFFTGEGGNGSLPAYSAVAHPGLTDGTGNYIFITWTKTTASSTGDIYTQPLVRVNWQ